jgi:hypothetical protein
VVGGRERALPDNIRARSSNSSTSAGSETASFIFDIA